MAERSGSRLVDIVGNRFFYGWIIVFASALLLAVSMGMFFSTNSVFVIPVCQSLGISRSQYTFHRTIMTLSAACVLPFYGRMIRRIGPKKILLIGAVALSIVTFGYSFANGIWHFYILAFVNGLFVNSISFLVMGIVLSNWFADKKGIATGIAFSGTGLGGAIMIPIVSRIIEVYDWRYGYRFIGILGLIILVPIIFVLIKEKPEDVGLKPYTLPEANEIKSEKVNTAVFDFSFKEAMRTNRFWLLAIVYMFLASVTSSTNTHSAPYFADIGYPTMIVSAIISLYMIFLTVGKIILGVIYDRFGTLAGGFCTAVCCLIFPAAALLSHLPVFPWVYAVAIGMASCGVSVPTTLLIIKYFGERDCPMIFSFFTMIMMIGSSIMVPGMGAVHDITGSYQLAWVIISVLAAIVAVSLILAEVSYRVSISKLERDGQAQHEEN